MRKKIKFFVFLFVLALSGPYIRVGGCPAAVEPPPEGGVLPDFNLPAPATSAEAAYLGIQGRDSFKIPQIKADVVIIEIFSMYCPHCQHEAPVVNRLYQAIADRPGLEGKVKILGIGAGNSPYEVKVFKDRYKIPFPLFPDEDFSVHTLIGEVRTPYFIVVRIKGDGSHQVIYSQLGAFGDPGDFLDLVIRRSGLKKGK